MNEITQLSNIGCSLNCVKMIGLHTFSFECLCPNVMTQILDSLLIAASAGFALGHLIFEFPQTKTVASNKV